MLYFIIWVVIGLLTSINLIQLVKRAEKMAEEGETALIPNLSLLYSYTEQLGGWWVLVFIGTLLWPYIWYRRFVS